MDKKEIKTKKIDAKLSIPVFDISGKEVRKTDLPKEIFNVSVKPSLLAQAVHVYLTNQRQGNASTKTRGQVTGSTRKIYRQKGTGKARHGDIKAPIFVGGGIVGGPKPKNYSLRLNKNQKTKALFGALSLKLKDQSIISIEDKSAIDIKKTKEIFNFLKSINLKDKKIVFIIGKESSENFNKACRNLKNIYITNYSTLNTYEMLKANKIIFFENAIKLMINHFFKK